MVWRLGIGVCKVGWGHAVSRYMFGINIIQSRTVAMSIVHMSMFIVFQCPDTCPSDRDCTGTPYPVCCRRGGKPLKSDRLRQTSKSAASDVTQLIRWCKSFLVAHDRRWRFGRFQGFRMWGFSKNFNCSTYDQATSKVFHQNSDKTGSDRPERFPVCPAAELDLPSLG